MDDTIGEGGPYSKYNRVNESTAPASRGLDPRLRVSPGVYGATYMEISPDSSIAGNANFGILEYGPAPIGNYQGAASARTSV